MYGLAAPLAAIALPLTILLAAAGPTTTRARLVVGVAGGFALWWLLGSGDLPDQTMRAAALMTVVPFAALSRRTGWSFTHRALAALALAAAGTAICFLAFDWSWQRLHWWTSFRTGAALRLMLGRAAASGGGSSGFGAGPRGFEELLDDVATLSADIFPAAVALQLFAGLAIGASLTHRLAGDAAGRAPGPLADFRFSEHLGWLLVLAVAILLLPGLAGRLAPGLGDGLRTARPLALNLLVVIGALYGLRGLAVIAFAIRALKGGLFLYLAATLAVFFVLPGVVLLGVLDAGLNLRRRWLPPPRGA